MPFDLLPSFFNSLVNEISQCLIHLPDIRTGPADPLMHVFSLRLNSAFYLLIVESETIALDINLERNMVFLPLRVVYRPTERARRRRKLDDLAYIRIVNQRNSHDYAFILKLDITFFAITILSLVRWHYSQFLFMLNRFGFGMIKLNWL